MPSHLSDLSFDARSSDSGIRRRRDAIRLNCAECRRLKIRCDRSNPCSSCVKRGCGAICPDGSLTTGQEHQFVAATRDELHEKNQQLSYRIRHLEEALQCLHSDRSMDPHPLLSEELLKMKTPLPREPLPPRSSNTFILRDQIHQRDVTNLSGSISVPGPGVSKYYGHTANSLYFLQNGRQGGTYVPDEVFNKLQHLLPPDILTKASMMPISYCPIFDRGNLRCLLPYLPTRTVSYELRTIFYTYASWMYNPVPEEMFDKEVFSVFYGSSASVQLQPGDPSVTHKLSLIFMILAIASVMDPSLLPYNMDAERYHQLARAALFQSSLFELATPYAVQALFLMSFYLFLMDRYGTPSESRWVIMGIAVKIGQSIGLHRDSAHWNLDAAETQHRRELFWEIFTHDSWQSLTFGRPPSLSLCHVDCKPPFSDCSGADEKIFHAWKHQFTLECISPLHEKSFGTEAPTYEAVLQLDKKICSFPIPPILRLPEPSSNGNNPIRYPVTIGLALQRHIVLAIREMNRLYLHRTFFAKAVADYSKGPLQSPYWNSILAVYDSARTFITLMQNLHTQAEIPCGRLWFLWAHMFSCAVVLATIVVRCPSVELAPTALDQLESASELFSKVARGFRAVDLLDVMRHLQRKARHYLSEYQRVGSFNSQAAAPYPGPVLGAYDIDEVTMLQGNVCIGSKLGLVHSSSPQVPPSLSPSPPTFAQNVPGADLLPGGFPVPHAPPSPETWSLTPPATNTVLMSPYNRANTTSTSSTGSTSSYRHDVASQTHLHPPLNVNNVTSFSISDYDYHRTSQMGFLEKQNRTFNTQYFQMGQMLTATIPGEARMFPESSESRIGSAWKDLAPNLQLP